MYNNEKRVIQKTVKIKPSVLKLAEQLTEITLPFSESDVSDYLERVIIIEAANFGILPDEQMKILFRSLNPLVADKQPVQEEQNQGLPLGKLSGAKK